MSAAPPPPPVSSEAINLVLDFLASKNFTAAETALRAQLARDAAASSEEAEELADVAVSVSSLEKLLESNPSRTAEGNGNPTGPADSVDPAPLPVSPVRAQPPVVFYDPAAFTAADEWSDDEDIGYRRIPCTEEALLTGNVPSPHRPPPSLPQGAPSARDPAFELFPNLQSRPLDERDLGGAARHDAPVHGGFDRPPREEEAPASAADSGAAATEAPPAENGDLEAEGGEADDEAEDEAADDETSASAAPPPASADVAAVPAEPADAPVSASAGASEGAPSAPAAVADAEGGAESSGEAATAQAPDDNKPEEAAQVAEAAAAEAPAAEAVAVEAPAAEAAAPAAEAPPATAAPTEEPAAPPVAETTVSLGRDSIHADFEAAPPDEDEGEGEEEDDDSVEADRLPTRPTRPTLPRTMGRRPPQEGDDDPYGDGLDPNMDADFADGGEEDAGEEEAEEAEEDEDEDEDEEEGEEVILESDPDIDPYERSAAEEAKYETLHLKVVHERAKTGFEEHKDFPIRINSLIAARYQVKEYLGSAAFSKAVQCVDLHSGELVCIKIIKNNKDFFDQSLDEIKLARRRPLRPCLEARRPPRRAVGPRIPPSCAPAVLRSAPLCSHAPRATYVAFLLRRAAAVHQAPRHGRLAQRASHLRLLLPQGAPLHRVRAAARQPLRVLAVQPRGGLRAVLHAAAAAAHRQAVPRRAALRAQPRPHPLRPQAREHPDQVVLALRDQGHRLWLVVLHQ